MTIEIQQLPYRVRRNLYTLEVQENVHKCGAWNHISNDIFMSYRSLPEFQLIIDESTDVYDYYGVAYRH